MLINLSCVFFFLFSLGCKALWIICVGCKVEFWSKVADLVEEKTERILTLDYSSQNLFFYFSEHFAFSSFHHFYHNFSKS